MSAAFGNSGAALFISPSRGNSLDELRIVTCRWQCGRVFPEKNKFPTPHRTENPEPRETKKSREENRRNPATVKGTANLHTSSRNSFY
jgi:hypothetical protein